jgi:hypothetical protein
MGPFLADRVSGGSAYWLCGVAITTSAVSLATLCPGRAAVIHHEREAITWNQGACKQARPAADHRKVLSVGPMLEAGSYRDVMRETVRAELAESSPWRIELTEAPSGGFFVDGTVDEMTVKHVGNTTRVYCELKLWVRTADQPISLLSGSANVDTSRNGRDIALSRQACVTTVAEDLVQRLLVGDEF